MVFVELAPEIGPVQIFAEINSHSFANGANDRYVVMPEHFHLLITEPEVGDPSVVMKAIKERFSRQVYRKRKRIGVSWFVARFDRAKKLTSYAFVIEGLTLGVAVVLLIRG